MKSKRKNKELEVDKKFKIKRLLTILIAKVEKKYFAYMNNGCDEYYSNLSYEIDEIIKEILELM